MGEATAIMPLVISRTAPAHHSSLTSRLQRATAVVVDVGFGNGSFIEDRARKNRETIYLGVEKSPSSFVRAFRRLRRARLSNIGIFHGDARFFLRSIVPEGSAERIYVNFPDPWPRRRHNQRRLLDTDFQRLAASRLKRDGRMLVTTDDHEYADFVVGQSQLASWSEFREGAPPPEVLDTRYARKWLRLERGIRHLVFVPGLATSHSHAPLELNEMQHALLEGDVTLAAPMRKVVLPSDLANIVVLDTVKITAGEGFVYLTLVEEPDLTQEVLIEARTCAEGVHVGLKRFGSPLATNAVGDAVRLISEYLETQGLRIKGAWYREPKP